MTEEEKLAEEYATENYEQCIYDDVIGWETDYEARKQAFLAGLKAKTQWHDLRKNPNDLPKEGTKVISEKGDFVFLQDKHWKEFSPNWDNIPLRKWEEPIAWCEIPKWEE